MKLSLNWLKEILVGLKNISDKDIIAAIESLGYELENMVVVGSGLEGVKIVKIVDIQKHPSADKLQLATIFDGKDKFTVVCGAPNIYVGMVAPYVGEGTVLPSGLKIEKRKIRGIESNGMLCSQKELCLGEDHTGIIELDNDFVLGENLRKYVEDVVIEISTPANRFDCLGHQGIVKELAVKFNLNYAPERIVFEDAKNLPFYDLKIESSDLCPRYIATNIINVNNNVKLPYFIKHRLSICGIRSINPLVDISNYVLLEIGHAVHIFDADKLEGNKIIVRKAKDGEKILALDGKEYPLSTSDIIIADSVKPVAIAGIIGGELSCVDGNTKNIVIESALFNRERIRCTRKRLGITTEASYRFERGSGWEMCNLAAYRTAKLVLLYCGGQLTKFMDLKDVEYQQKLNRNLKVNLNFISQLLGLNLVEDDLFRVVKGLGGEFIFSEKQTGNYVIVPPSSRLDWVYQADIAEEIARFKGYDKIENTFPTTINAEPEKRDYELFIKQIMSYFSSVGFSQVMNYSLCSEMENKMFKDYEGQRIVIANPLSQEYSQMRLSLFSGLIRNFITNRNSQIDRILLYEIGKIYYKNREGKIKEEEQLAFLVSGEEKIISWKNDVIKYDRYFSNGIVETLLKNCKIRYKKTYPEIEKKDFINKFNGQISDVVEYVVGEEVVSYVCEIDKSKFKIKSNFPIFYGEIYIEKLFDYFNLEKKFVPLVRYPFIARDLCLAISQDISYEQILDIIESFSNQNKDFCEIAEIEIFDYYRKEDVSYVTFSLKFQSKERTLTDEEVNNVFFKLVDVLGSYKIELRK